MPRNENEAWREFHVTTDANGKKLSMKCRHCAKVWQKANATRCTEHLPKCPKLPINLRRAYGYSTGQMGGNEDEPEQSRDGAGASVSGGKLNIHYKLKSTELGGGTAFPGNRHFTATVRFAAQ